MAVLSKLKLIVHISRSKNFFVETDPEPPKRPSEINKKGPKLNKTTIDFFNLITQQDSERLKENQT